MATTRDLGWWYWFVTVGLGEQGSPGGNWESIFTPLKFAKPGLYRYVRHPLYVGWLFTFWAALTMTVAHLAFSIATSAYILIAIQFEERDLVQVHGTAYYDDYRKQVPMLVPGLRPSIEGDARMRTA